MMTKYQIVRKTIDILIGKNAFNSPFSKQDYENVEKLHDDLCKDSQPTPNELANEYINKYPRTQKPNEVALKEVAKEAALKESKPEVKDSAKTSNVSKKKHKQKNDTSQIQENTRERDNA